MRSSAFMYDTATSRQIIHLQITIMDSEQNLKSNSLHIHYHWQKKKKRCNLLQSPSNPRPFNVISFLSFLFKRNGSIILQSTRAGSLYVIFLQNLSFPTVFQNPIYFILSSLGKIQFQGIFTPLQRMLIKMLAVF